MTAYATSSRTPLHSADPALAPLVAPTRRTVYDRAGTEPSLADLLNDPLTHAVMARDNLHAHDLHRVVRDAREKIRARRTAA